jgi:8-oxo-dGTP pyrophosphatase MutT (NUDIX family)/phosphohistidine phosphatase SixA
VNIRAAGALLWRKDSADQIEVAIIHRPRYDDWSLPKGKVESGESELMCAYREVLEETGFPSIFGPELGVVVYSVAGIPKVVRYWSARAIGGEVQEPDSNEVDIVQWLSVDLARARLTSRDDRFILDSFIEKGVSTGTLILLRHATAVAPHEWDGDDGDRPLNYIGQTQAATLARILAPYFLESIHTSDAVRCIQTVEPLAKKSAIRLKISQDLSEYKNPGMSAAAVKYAEQFFASGESTLICSHAPILPRILKRIIGGQKIMEPLSSLQPGCGWVVHHNRGAIIAIDEIRPTVEN